MTITLLSGWNWYVGPSTPVPASQWDYQTALTHELSHAVSLDHDAALYAYLNDDGRSATHPQLGAGDAHRRFSDYDLPWLTRLYAHGPHPDGEIGNVSGGGPVTTNGVQSETHALLAARNTPLVPHTEEGLGLGDPLARHLQQRV